MDLNSIINQASDDSVTVDFSAAVEFGPLPVGTYKAAVESVEPGVTGPNSKNPGTPKVVWRFVVIEGPSTGRVVFKHTNITGKGAGLTKDVLRALGVSGLDSANVTFSMGEQVGKEVYLDVEIQADNPKFNEITDIRAAAPSAPSPLASL